ncbi:uncharacterized protein LOC115453744 [Manduca sexta]|uniref:uncharacterized protein LOC115453744 n=1 Tax=Manduca sexta TaxID=7130 RepID=UPI00188F2CD5|nr:uncharacterized protein LOC115453744 [Manduca sexta]
MKMKSLLHFLLQITIITHCFGSDKKPVKYNQTKPESKFHNPNFVRDRFKNVIFKPELPESWKHRFRKPFHPAWMDYCDPYHCNDYHKLACGLNRSNMRFKWFQSGCHIILNNQCATYRGSLKYDVVDPKFCMIYVMYLRSNCPDVCRGYVQPVCGVSSFDGHAVLFVNRCAMEMVNCRSNLPEYEEVKMEMCLVYANKLKKYYV